MFNLSTQKGSKSVKTYILKHYDQHSEKLSRHAEYTRRNAPDDARECTRRNAPDDARE
jgi:hypothetical protein